MKPGEAVRKTEAAHAMVHRGWAKASARAAGTLMLAVLGSAGAQDLSAYNAVATNLDAAYQTSGTNAEATLTQLDRATESFKQLEPTLRNRQIAGGISDALAGARAALARTPAEVQAQVLLARGLMRRALQDQTLTLLAGAPANGDAQLRVLAREFGLSTAAAQALSTDARAGRLERVAWRLQRSAALQVSAALASARPVRSGAALPESGTGHRLVYGGSERAGRRYPQSRAVYGRTSATVRRRDSGTDPVVDGAQNRNGGPEPRSGESAESSGNGQHR